ncbi:MAG: hypothetical protein ABIR16_00270, partial [Dokdonella sp.]
VLLWWPHDTAESPIATIKQQATTQPTAMSMPSRTALPTPAAIAVPTATPPADLGTAITPVPATKREGASPPSAAMPSEPRTQLPAEAGLVTGNGVDMKAIGKLMKSDDFDETIDRLSEQSLQEPLAMDLTALNSAVMAEASRSVPDVSVQRMACGLQVCVALLSATSEDSVRQWGTSFQTNPSSPVRTMGLHPMKLADGSIEFRLVISTYPTVNRAFMRPGG